MKVSSLTELIGDTPLLELARYSERLKLKAKIFAKLESFNPYSVKDRAALFMIEGAERDGKLKKEGVIVEPTSGNTGIGLAFVARLKGYKVILTMPETMSEERKKLLSLLGAKLILTDGKKGMRGAIEEAEKILKDTAGAFMPLQFDNPDNAAAHEQTTGPEIVRDLNGKVAAFVAGVGTGGTLTGAGKVLKEKCGTLVYAAEPASSPVLSGGVPSSHRIQGIGAGFIPALLNTDIIDGIITVRDDEALASQRLLCEIEGLLCGISSGAALYAAAELAKKPEFAGKNIVTVFPDSGERYLSIL